jgi:hypothetical protein
MSTAKPPQSHHERRNLMFTSFTVRSFRSKFSGTSGRARSIFAIAALSAFLAIPAVAYAAKATTTRTDLAGTAGYCQNYDTTAPTAPAVGNAQIETFPSATEGFHSVRVNIRARAGQVQAGTYPVWLVNVYRDDAGNVIGCAASPLANPLTVKSGRPVDFRGSVDRYSGQYELQVYVGQIWGPGYGTSPATVDVP